MRHSRRVLYRPAYEGYIYDHRQPARGGETKYQKSVRSRKAEEDNRTFAEADEDCLGEARSESGGTIKTREVLIGIHELKEDH
jgi:hypothetical protein